MSGVDLMRKRVISVSVDRALLLAAKQLGFRPSRVLNTALRQMIINSPSADIKERIRYADDLIDYWQKQKSVLLSAYKEVADEYERQKKINELRELIRRLRLEYTFTKMEYQWLQKLASGTPIEEIDDEFKSFINRNGNFSSLANEFKAMLKLISTDGNSAAGSFVRIIQNKISLYEQQIAAAEKELDKVLGEKK